VCLQSGELDEIAQNAFENRTNADPSASASTAIITRQAASHVAIGFCGSPAVVFKPFMGSTGAYGGLPVRQVHYPRY